LALAGGACTPDSELSDRELFSKYCAECHGDDGRGAPDYPREEGREVDLLASQRLRAGDRRFVERRIAEGYGPMPAFARKLDPPDLDRLVELVLRLASPTAQGGQDGPPEVESRVSEAPGPG
jgi:mono/diheme cytochrome c family protein